MNRLLLTLILPVLVTGCDVHMANWVAADLTAVVKNAETNALPSDLKTLQVDNGFGTVHVLGTNGTNVSWAWMLTIRATNNATAQDLAAATVCQVETNGGQLSLTVIAPASSVPHSFQSDFEIIVPQSAVVRVKNQFGAIYLTDLDGHAEADDQNGPVEMQNIAGDVRAQTAFDHLTVNHTGPATLKNQNGSIHATDINGALNAGTSFDSLIAHDVHGPATLDNQNGRIEADTIAGTLKAQTSFDSLDARKIGGAIHLRNQNGRVQADHIQGNADIETSFDSLTLTDVTGHTLHLRNQNGSVKVNHATGDANIETSFASLAVEDLQGDVTLKNQNGSVTARDISGSVKAATSFASLDLVGPGPAFLCHNQNGAIHIRATSATLTTITADTSFDAIKVQLPAGIKPAVVAHTTFDNVESDYPVLMKPHDEDPFADTAPGTPRLKLENQNGPISIREIKN
jgi:DUF4097 and DUF4098 domain-containing protein YvlB